MRIKEIRVSAGLTQEQTAEKLGITRSAVAMWETGQSSPTANMLPAIADVFGCTINDLFTDSDQKEA